MSTKMKKVIDEEEESIAVKPKVKKTAKQTINDKKEQKEKFNEQLVKLEEKIAFHKDKVETLSAKKIILDNKIKKL